MSRRIHRHETNRPIQICERAISISPVRSQASAVIVGTHVVRRRLDGKIQICEPMRELSEYRFASPTIGKRMEMAGVGTDCLIKKRNRRLTLAGSGELASLCKRIFVGHASALWRRLR
jgi:hypothetical protein